jgi:hypothetical protein
VVQPEIRGGFSIGVRIDSGDSGAIQKVIHPLQSQSPSSGAESPYSGPDDRSTLPKEVSAA